ncbi:MAG: hypothetical protein JWQ16_521, partial [Novosphingobium sp.]|nr:hypothetical protein [Novosphingobium sp.]
FDSNLYSRDSPRVADMAFVMRPALRISPDLARHELSLDVAGEVRRYLSTPAENSEQYFIQLSGRADLADRTTVTAHGFIARRIERRGTFGDQFLTDAPLGYLEREAGVEIARKGGQFDLSGAIATNRKTYSNATLGGVPLDQSIRNVRQDSARIRAGFRVSPAISVFAEADGSRFSYDREPTGPRGSTGYSALAGARIEYSDVTNVEVAVGYLRQNFVNPVTPTVSGLTYSVTANWTPTPRLRLALVGTRSVERSPILGAEAVLESDFRLSAVYAVGSRLLVGLEAGLVKDDYRGVDRAERRYFSELSLRYAINRHLSAFTAAGYRTQSGSGLGARSYDGATARVGLTLAQ